MGGGLAGVFSSLDATRWLTVFRMRGAPRNILLFAGVALAAFVITLVAVPGSPVGGREVAGPLEAPIEAGHPSAPTAPEDGSIAPDPTEPPASSHSTLRGFVLPIAEIKGVSTTARSGTPIEVWVSWRRDVARGPRVQRVVKAAVVGEVQEPTVAGGPETIELLIPVEDFPDFLAAHEFGTLSAASLPQ